MTNQEIFDKALAGVLAQGCRAMEHGSCVYFEQDTGNRCAIGQLLDPDIAEEWQIRADSNQAGTGINSVTREIPYCKETLLEAVGEVSLGFLTAIQFAHDTCADDMNVFRNEMRNIADRHNLTYSEPSC